MADVTEDPFLTPTQVAKIFAVKSYTVRRWINEGKLPAIMLNKRLKIRKSDVQKLAQDSFGSEPSDAN